MAYSSYDRTTRQSTLILSTLDGVDETLLSRAGFFIARFEWSPDGRHLALAATSALGDEYRLYRLDVADRSLTQLSPDAAGTVRSLAWSPDGAEIAYSAGADVRIVGVDGADDRLIARGSSYVPGQGWDCGGLNPNLAVTDWSPDGTQLLLYANEPCAEYISSDLAVVRPDGTGLRELVETGGHEESASFSPDGRQVLFYADGINTVNRDGSGLRHVTHGFAPSWSPTGAIVFTRGVYEAGVSGTVNQELWVADATGIRRLSSERLFAASPRWSPDGTVVGYFGMPRDTTALLAVPVEGGRSHQVSRSAGSDVGWFDFRPLPAEPVTTVSARLAGADRYATAAAIATEVQRQRSAPSQVALLARGDAFPDGLAAANLGTFPLLLTPKNSLHPATRSSLASLGIREVRIIGGTGAVSDSVEAELRQAGFAVNRLAGGDRYATAVATFDATRASRGIGTLAARRTVIIASGERFPDALAAGPVAAGARLPILLTTSDRLADATAQALDACRTSCPEQAIIVGGTAAVGPLVELELQRRGLHVRRVAGNTRQSTAAAIATLAADELGWTITHANIARGDNFPDALAAGPLGGVEQSPTLLTHSPVALGTPARLFLHRHAITVTSLHVLGDGTAVPRAPVLEARRASS